MKLTEAEILEKLKAFTGWEYRDGALHKTYGLGEFSKVMEFVNKVAMIAEKQQHHPDMHVSYGTVGISTQTHDLDGISPKDFELIKLIEQLVLEFI